MPDVIEMSGLSYSPWSCFVDDEDPEFASRTCDHQSFVSSNKLSLRKSCGAYLSIDARPIALIVDPASVVPGSPQWRLIGAIAQCLEKAAPHLTQDARAALGSLKAVIFLTAPDRAYSDVEAQSFVYDVDEFATGPATLVSPAFAASNIVHDAHHIWLAAQGRSYTGPEAEVTCWSLQVANAAALGLSDLEVDYLRGLIANPASQIARMEQDPLARCAHSDRCGAIGQG